MTAGGTGFDGGKTQIGHELETFPPSFFPAVTCSKNRRGWSGSLGNGNDKFASSATRRMPSPFGVGPSTESEWAHFVASSPTRSTDPLIASPPTKDRRSFGVFNATMISWCQSHAYGFHLSRPR